MPQPSSCREHPSLPSNLAESRYCAQAVGAGRLDIVPEVFQKCLLFLSLHALPASGLLLCVPRLFQAMGQAPEVRSLFAPLHFCQYPCEVHASSTGPMPWQVCITHKPAFASLMWSASSSQQQGFQGSACMTCHEGLRDS